MAARIIEDDERLTTEEPIDQETQEIPEAGPLEQEQPQTQEEQELPEKYRNKSAAELAKMHQEAEKALGRHSAEVGELRKVVDQYIQTQLSAQQAPQSSSSQSYDDEEVDFFEDPDKAVARAIEKHPKIKEAERVTNEYRKSTALAQLQRKHSDMQQILGDPKFAEWVQSSKIRVQLFQQADQGYDFDAADELLSLWKDRQQTVQQTAQVEKAARKDSVKAASTGNARGNPDGNSGKKVYRRSDIIKLMKTDPERYQALSDEIIQAYAEGRVK